MQVHSKSMKDIWSSTNESVGHIKYTSANNCSYVKSVQILINITAIICTRVLDVAYTFISG